MKKYPKGFKCLLFCQNRRLCQIKKKIGGKPLPYNDDWVYGSWSTILVIHRFLLLLKTYTKRAFFVSVYVLVFGVMPVWDWVYRCVRYFLKFSVWFVFVCLVMVGFWVDVFWVTGAGFCCECEV